MIFYIFLFLLSGLLLMVAGNWLVKALSRIAEFLGWKEFTVAFFLMSLATAAPELLVGVSSALKGIPELSLGNIIGQNIIHFAVAIPICVFFLGGFSVAAKTTRVTAYFSGLMALFPLVLIVDGTLGRLDGLALIATFLIYAFWLTGRRRRFSRRYDHPREVIAGKPLGEKLKLFFQDFGLFGVGATILILASQGIVVSAMYFAESWHIPLIVIGTLIVGLGTAIPEIYFSALAAKKGEGELAAGNLLGSTAVSTSLVLGLVALVSPIENIALPAYVFSRLFLFLAVSLFIFFMSTGRKITLKEGQWLFLVYIAFVITEIMIGLK
ncbi:MAG: hypothetical protein COV08_01905 [Candidatus Vogelbacteria bacterium CG10_big_fil_rev_8_21_14_0_10_49_38]|uniref:Sodium/calcium exchanger membrane region domain-containing protein n=1 Tax=Candidatus Vogelbacteria bacterium CG10_big_fil_rev_8_21_14_0_10_49_38 TaxID=1975043 RepID=A0A2H0RHN5_9BACT|nr:MAG: hypothetical protein BK006_01925 [bacterium CG10_49_38]PIR46008.1 MAG: hypothetical protein COV08_01905 [Candidatus Vogelbacteria bacterium CG10_big_fil_rev_8_21_14_0_10_49_38]